MFVIFLLLGEKTLNCVSEPYESDRGPSSQDRYQQSVEPRLHEEGNLLLAEKLFGVMHFLTLYPYNFKSKILGN